METDVHRTRATDWLTAAAALALLLGLAALVTGKILGATLALAAAAGGTWAARQSSQRQPGPMPHALRRVLYLPRWPPTPTRLRAILAPRPGERILEIGPGVGIYSIPIAEGDAQRLPYEDGSLDAAFVVGVLGEIPDPAAALRELRRVLKRNGRLIVGEILGFDPDAVRLPALVALAGAAGFTLERRLGPPFAYFARFAPQVVSADRQSAPGE